MADDAIALIRPSAAGIKGVVIGVADGGLIDRAAAYDFMERFGEPLCATFRVLDGVEASVAHFVAVAAIMELEEADGMTGVADGVRPSAAL